MSTLGSYSELPHSCVVSRDSQDSLSALNDLVNDLVKHGGMSETYGVLAQQNLRLAHENLLLRAIEENRRLAHENMLLRMQSQVRAPPGLSLCESDSGVPPGVFTKPMQHHPRPQSMPEAFALPSSEPTTAGPSPSTSAEGSRAPSDDGQDCSNDVCLSVENLDSGGTSVMMRNLPYNYNQKMLLDHLMAEGYAGKFDFAYLPLDFQSGNGLGYAFVNLVTPEVAEDFCEHFTGFDHWTVASDKVCQVTWSDLQGLSAHVERYRNSPVMHDSIADDHKPLLFHGIEQLPFPAPTKKIRAPRRWNRRH